ncbi:MAG: hypothetical protein GC159_16985 [Phycisphaera sp.]|nr:hypothetical protein [Phycisphaera sp.]
MIHVIASETRSDESRLVSVFREVGVSAAPVEIAEASRVTPGPSSSVDRSEPATPPDRVVAAVDAPQPQPPSTQPASTQPASTQAGPVQPAPTASGVPAQPAPKEGDQPTGPPQSTQPLGSTDLATSAAQSGLAEMDILFAEDNLSATVTSTLPLDRVALEFEDGTIVELQGASQDPQTGIYSVEGGKATYRVEGAQQSKPIKAVHAKSGTNIVGLDKTSGERFLNPHTLKDNLERPSNWVPNAIAQHPPDQFNPFHIIDNSEVGSVFVQGNATVLAQGEGIFDNDYLMGFDRVAYVPVFEQGGPYRVELWFPQTEGALSAVTVIVLHGDGAAVRVVDQRQGGLWIDIGPYNFRPGATQGVVILGDDPHVLADAVRFTRGALPLGPWDTVRGATALLPAALPPFFFTPGPGGSGPSSPILP